MIDYYYNISNAFFENRAISEKSCSKFQPSMDIARIFTFTWNQLRNEARMAYAKDPTKDPKWKGMYDTFYPKYIPFKETPHHSTWSSIEGIWQLEHTRDVLARHGLKDPWMRNEIWRYPSFAPHRNFAKTFVDMFFGPKKRGMIYGFLITTGIVTGENIYYKLRYGHKPCFLMDFRTWLDEFYESHPKFENQ